MKKLLAVIGHPVSHSLSPSMHNVELEHFNLPFDYKAIDVSESVLQETVVNFKEANIAGFNVTIPHKEAIIPYLDSVDEEALEIGAVNTVVNQAGKLVGYNTDGQGYLQALIKVCPHWKESNILIVGAGGAARAIYVTLLRNGATCIDLTNRSIDRAVRLRDTTNGSRAINSKALSIKDAEERLKHYDIIINTTPIGMTDQIKNIPISLDKLKSNAVLSDIIYTPMKTTWLQLGETKGATIMNGVEMFVEQGALAFSKWTGKIPNRERMKKTVYHHLKERKDLC